MRKYAINFEAETSLSINSSQNTKIAIFEILPVEQTNHWLKNKENPKKFSENKINSINLANYPSWQSPEESDRRDYSYSNINR